MDRWMDRQIVLLIDKPCRKHNFGDTKTVVAVVSLTFNLLLKYFKKATSFRQFYYYLSSYIINIIT